MTYANGCSKMGFMIVEANNRPFVNTSDSDRCWFWRYARSNSNLMVEDLKYSIIVPDCRFDYEESETLRPIFRRQEMQKGLLH